MQKGKGVKKKMADTANRGLASADEETRERVAHEGGVAAQQSGHAHKLTEDERSKGGSNSGGNFKNDPGRAAEAGRKGGSQ